MSKGPFAISSPILELLDGITPISKPESLLDPRDPVNWAHILSAQNKTDGELHNEIWVNQWSILTFDRNRKSLVVLDPDFKNQKDFRS